MLIAIDPGKTGAVIGGDSPETAEAIDYPTTPEEFYYFAKNYWEPGSKVIIEKTIGTVWLGGEKCGRCYAPKNLAQNDKAARVMNLHKGLWQTALVPFKEVTEPAPVTWRRLWCGDGRKYKGHEWKRQELFFARDRFPLLNWRKYKTAEPPTSPGAKIYGLSAAACLFWVIYHKGRDLDWVGIK